MTYNASDPEALDLGFTLPRGTDLIRNGDDAITTNALVATGALRAAFNRLRTLEDAPPPIADHGDLTGRGDDDHPQYLNNTRGDARYAPLTHSHAWADVTGKPSNFPPSAHVHGLEEVTGLTAALDGKAATGHAHTAAQVGAVPADDLRVRDTGWRSLPPSPRVQMDPAAPGRILIRRQGNRVSLALDAVKIAADTTARVDLLTASDATGVPTGFRPIRARHVFGYAMKSNAIAITYSVNVWSYANFSVWSSINISTAAANQTPGWKADDPLCGELTWTTDDTWPTTLPGTPA